MDGRDLQPLRSFSRVDNLWFEDADVVFRAGKSKFRVYRGILSAQSVVFRDMLVRPQRSEETDSRNHNPIKKQDSSLLVIDLPDEETDVCCFFLAIFDPSFYMPPPSKYDLEVTVAVLSLAVKYKVPFLVHRAILHLDTLFPLDEKSILESAQLIKKAKDARHLKYYLDSLPLVVSADATWIIPTLLFILNRTYPLESVMVHPSFLQLSSDLQIIIFRSCVNSALERSHGNSWVGMLPSPGCADEAVCAFVSRSAQTLSRTSEGPLYWDVKMSLQDGRMFCRNCQAAGRKHQNELGETYWNQYAKIGGFKNWEEARKLRSRARAGSGKLTGV